MKFTFNIDISWKIWYIFYRAVSRFLVKGLLQSTSEICKKRKENEAMQKLKRLLALGAAAMMLVGSASLPVSAIEPNTDDYKWSFNVEPTRLSTVTKEQEKVDASYTYVNTMNGRNQGYFTCDVLSPAGRSQCKKTGANSQGRKRPDEQYVYENGHRKCKLKLTSPEGSYGGGTDKWSPDSIVTYRVINK